ncbi:MAG: ATP-binding protein, partial [Myxococcota bacterium]
HEIEDTVVETGDAPQEPSRTALAEQWAELHQHLSDLLGDRDDGIELSEEEYCSLIDAVEGGRSSAELLSLIRAWRMEPAAVRLNRAREQAKGIANRVHKPNIEVDIDVGDVRLAAERFRPFWQSFVHVLRNAIDHGIETPDERVASGKEGPGRIGLTARVEGDDFVVVVSDDGRGIDWDGVRAKAARQGLPSATEQDLREALFRDGFTTRDSTSLLSGRGIGLGAVRTAVDDLGGHITVSSGANSGTHIGFAFPLGQLDDAVRTTAAASSRAPEPV